jgi:hypothetical protein
MTVENVAAYVALLIVLAIVLRAYRVRAGRARFT